MHRVPGNPTVVVLGGAGGMGRVAVVTAAAFGDIGELVVADRDFSAAESVVSECASEARPQRLDPRDGKLATCSATNSN